MDVLKFELIQLKSLLIKGFYSKPQHIALTIAGLGVSYFAYVTLRLYLYKRKYQHIPGPPTHGILGFYKGNISDLNKAIKSGKIFPELLVEWHKIYGDLFKFQIFNRIIVFTVDRDTIKEVLIEKNYPKSQGQADRAGFPMGERFLGVGLVTDFLLEDLDNKRWKKRRALFNPGFHKNVLMTFVDHFNQISNILTEKLRTIADGKTVVNLFNEINRATLDAIALIAFGMNTDAVNKKDSELNAYLSRILKIMMNIAFDPFMRYRPLKHAEVKEFKRMTRYLRKVGKEKIVERIKAIENNEYVPNDILTSILSEYKGSEELDIEDMTDDFITFFVAGQETTANALAFCFLEIGKNPDIVAKAREEIDRVLGERSEVTYQDIHDLKYCSAIFKEALRLYPPATSVARRTLETVNANGIEIPANTELLMSTFVTGRCEKYFKEPIEFKPERFLKSSNSDAGVENYVYFPFSLGPRNCIGQNFAQIEGVVIIAKLIQKFDLKLDPTQSLALDQAITLRPKDGTRCFLSLRS